MRRRNLRGVQVHQFVKRNVLYVGDNLHIGGEATFRFGDRGLKAGEPEWKLLQVVPQRPFHAADTAAILRHGEFYAAAHPGINGHRLRSSIDVAVKSPQPISVAGETAGDDVSLAAFSDDARDGCISAGIFLAASPGDADVVSRLHIVGKGHGQPVLHEALQPRVSDGILAARKEFLAEDRVDCRDGLVDRKDADRHARRLSGARLVDFPGARLRFQIPRHRLNVR